MIAHRMTNPPALTAVVLIASLAMACGLLSRPEAIDAAKSPEQSDARSRNMATR